MRERRPLYGIARDETMPVTPQFLNGYRHYYNNKKGVNPSETALKSARQLALSAMESEREGR